MRLPFPLSSGRPWPARCITLLAVAAAIAPLAIVSIAHASEYEFSWSHPRPQGDALGGADFEDASIGFAVGNRGSVVKTTDGGLSWSLVEHVPAFATDLEDVLVLAPDHLLAVGAPPGILVSVNGGASWTPVPNPSTSRLYDLARISGSELSAVGAVRRVIVTRTLGESLLLAGFGGYLGLAGAWAVTEVVWRIPVQSQALQILGKPTLSIPLGVITAICLIGISCLAGSFPARRAARLNPVEALRHE